VDKAFLEFTRGGHAEMIAIGPGRFTLGRASGNDLSFPEDGTVSGYHAVIEQHEGCWLIRDLGSVTGTSVHGQKIRRPRLLGSGISILLGQAQLAFGIARLSQAPAAPTPSGCLDVTEEWGDTGIPSVPGHLAGPGRDRPAAPWSQSAAGQGQGSPGGDESQMARARGNPLLSLDSTPADRQQVMRGRGWVQGTAHGVRVSQDSTSSILSFQVKRYNAMGNRPPVGAELIGLVTGELSNGEEVELFSRWSHGTHMATKMTNLSTSAQVREVPAEQFAVKELS
jgi:hypothetical protein